MKLVALVRPAERPEDAARALAGATGLTLAEARMRLAPEPPALLARLEEARADALVAALRTAGLAVLAVDAACPADEDCIVARSFALEDTGGTFTPRAGEPVRIVWPEVRAILRGVRASRTEVQRVEKSKTLSVGRAVLTGGLVMSRTKTTRSSSSTESTEQVVLVYLRDGRTVRLAEQQLEFSCLGPAMQPSSMANMLELVRQLRAHAKGAFHDERLVRLGRRPLPFVMDSGARAGAGTTVTTRSDTADVLDLLAEVMWRAVVEGLLP